MAVLRRMRINLHPTNGVFHGVFVLGQSTVTVDVVMMASR
jgi:hypothetical protein